MMELKRNALTQQQFMQPIGLELRRFQALIQSGN
jgi:hypothetical protein